MSGTLLMLGGFVGCLFVGVKQAELAGREWGESIGGFAFFGLSTIGWAILSFRFAARMIA